MGDFSVAECMHAGVVSCGPDATLDEVAATMRGANVSAIVVVERGVAAGLISRTDLVNVAFVQPYVRYWRGMAARHFMSAPVVSVRPEARLSEALALLRARRIHRLVVTEPGPGGERPVGILSLSDVLRVLGESKDGEQP
jgi:CBS domain-containing protein